MHCAYDKQIQTINKNVLTQKSQLVLGATNEI